MTAHCRFQRLPKPLALETLALAVLVVAMASCSPSTTAPPGTPPPPVAVSLTPLDDYVAAPDPGFSYQTPPETVAEEPAYAAYAYRMTSQTWLTPDKVDRTAWEHWVLVVVPAEVAHTQAMMFIGGGSNRGGDAPSAPSELAQVAVLTKSIVAEVKQIPNQPLRFPDEHDDRYKEKGRSEDDMIAYAWDKYLITGDPLWLPRLPMTKAVVRAMDLVQKEHPEVDGFLVAGGSKRGWTTWTVAAVDKRVVAITPAVIDVLDVVSSLDNHHAAYGFWAPAVGSYDDMNVLARLHTPEFAALCDVVDPISYVDRLTMPKYIVNSAGDQFFPPDSWRFYFDKLKGEKYLRYMPNTDHGLNIEAYFNLASFYKSVLAGVPRPEFTWKMETGGALEVRCETVPTKVVLWQATNPEARDFRLESIGEAWSGTPAEESGPGVFRAALDAPPSGWTAFFLELEFPNPVFDSPFKFTTGVSIVPDTLPHPPVPAL
ncbi:MAG: PhoPQ-activated pathogenicity [Candidatus Hydrogenedentes bacterium]|nr:PhoPQ-activated pathogenicity [Candidatus Hydrogenedentota bacterium]